MKVSIFYISELLNIIQCAGMNLTCSCTDFSTTGLVHNLSGPFSDHGNNVANGVMSPLDAMSYDNVKWVWSREKTDFVACKQATRRRPVYACKQTTRRRPVYASAQCLINTFVVH